MSIAHPLVPEVFQVGSTRGSAFAACEALIPAPSLPVPPDEEAPCTSGDGDNHQDNLPALPVGFPLGGVQLSLLGLLVRGAVPCSTSNGRLGALFAVETGVGWGATNATDVDAHEPIEHVARPARVIKRHHVAGVGKENIGEVTGLLIKPGILALKQPVPSWSPCAGGNLEALAAIELHVGDECFRAQVIADEILGARKEEDGDLSENIGEEFDGRV